MQSVQTIVRAAALLKGRCEVRWHIVGDGSALEECRQLAGQLELGDTLTFYGRRPVEEMPEFYALADAMLITLADNEMIARTLPGKMQSYLAAGKPVLGAIGGETRQVIEQSGCGLCCEPEDADGLALLAKAFCQSGEREQMAQKARRFYEEHYRKDLFLERLEDELEKLAKE